MKIDETWTYIGDGLYAKHDGFGVDVVSYNGIEVLDRIYLEPQVLEALNKVKPTE